MTTIDESRVFVRAYMERVCTCGHRRAEHGHFVEPKNGQLHVLAVNNVKCSGFLDAIELQLGGNPAENPLIWGKNPR